MISVRRSARVILFALLAAFVSVPSFAQATDQAQNARSQSISKQVKCVCGGCDMTAGTCTHSGGAFAGPCDTAKQELKEVSDRVGRGESNDLVLQDFVQEYGPTVLVEPPKKGFNWLVWILPAALPIIAVIFVWAVVQRWHERSALAPAGGPPISPELLDRARHETRDDGE